MLFGHKRNQGFHWLSVQIDILGVTANTIETLNAIRMIDHILRHGLHHDKIDMGDFIIAGFDGLTRAHPSGDVTMDVKP